MAGETGEGCTFGLRVKTGGVQIDVIELRWFIEMRCGKNGQLREVDIEQQQGFGAQRREYRAFFERCMGDVERAVEGSLAECGIFEKNRPIELCVIGEFGILENGVAPKQ